MRDLKQILKRVKRHRHIIPDRGDDGFALQIEFHGAELRIIASWGLDWDHVSIHIEGRCPTWAEMCFVKNIFWENSECVIQYHPPDKQYIDVHSHCLHLWRPQKTEIPMPPLNLV